ncbi:MAG: NADH-quinone oxidoreductase subunit J [Candidatus Omnitrophica bacterium]|nr:NADH-quinone oxidoreductase subunit J [Candidatus Omnitrophota bacterium]
MQDLVFYFIAGCACVFAVLAVTQRSIFHCALWLAMTLLSVAGVYFYLEAPFLGAIQILVYVGGIITLFVFAIKLTAHIEDKSIRQLNTQWLPAALISLLLFYILIQAFASHPWKNIIPNAPVTSLQVIGRSLMTGYALPFEFMSVILLGALVGAIVIGKVKK